MSRAAASTGIDLESLCDAVRAAYPRGPEAAVAIVRTAFAALLARDAERAAELAALRGDVAALKRRLDADSTTSSKPPSTDVSHAVRPVSLRVRTGRRPGGQPGHRGGTLAWRADPERILAHRPSACTHCVQPLAADAVGEVAERARVVDLPPVRLVTTEHRRVSDTCVACAQVTTGVLPPGVGGAYSVQYGPELEALAVALHSYHLVPYGRTVEFLDALLGDGPSAGSPARWTREAARALGPAQQASAAAIRAGPTAHADETGLHVGRKTWWLHVAATATHTHYHVDRRRGFAGIDAGGVWSASASGGTGDSDGAGVQGFRGTLVHDCLASYFQYDAATHQRCLAHLRREAKGLSRSPRT